MHAHTVHTQGAAFGFSTIASQAQEQLAPYLPTLVPRLYRYKYDPIPRIQLAMSSIWSSLVPNSKKAVSNAIYIYMQGSNLCMICDHIGCHGESMCSAK